MTTTKTPEQRREIADEHIARLRKHSRAMEREGRYYDAQDAVDAAADWDFWAVHGVERVAYEEAFQYGED